MGEASDTRDTLIPVRAVLLGERINTAGMEREKALSTTPLAFRLGDEGIAVLFRYGVAVFLAATRDQQQDVVRRLDGRIVGAFAQPEEEAAQIRIAPSEEEQIAPDGTIVVKALTTEHALLIADALATNVILARDEDSVSHVFDVIEPLARRLADEGRTPGGRRAILRHIGQALLVQQRISGLVAVEEKPDVLWERPELERFYVRLENEYELKERADVLNRKLAVIGNTAQALADIIDTERSIRLEQIIVALILIEVGFSLYHFFVR